MDSRDRRDMRERREGEERGFPPCRVRLAHSARLAAVPVMNQFLATHRDIVPGINFMSVYLLIRPPSSVYAVVHGSTNLP
jgi:hypothetical protein